MNLGQSDYAPRAPTRSRYTRYALALLLAAAPGPGWAAASATPVPFPPPASAESQSRDLADLNAFLQRAEQHAKDVYRLSERYRAYVAQGQRLIATCEVDSALEAHAGHPFARLIGREERSCAELREQLQREAQTYTARLDEAVAFLAQLEQARASAQRQKDQLLLAQHAERLRARLEASWAEHAASQQALAPWLGGQVAPAP